MSFEIVYQITSEVDHRDEMYVYNLPGLPGKPDRISLLSLCLYDLTKDN
jgi:hypothetical protein